MINEIEIMEDMTLIIGAMNIASSSSTSVPFAIASIEKPGKCIGMDFKWWKQKMLI